MGQTLGEGELYKVIFGVSGERLGVSLTWGATGQLCEEVCLGGTKIRSKLCMVLCLILCNQYLQYLKKCKKQPKLRNKLTKRWQKIQGSKEKEIELSKKFEEKEKERCSKEGID